MSPHLPPLLFLVATAACAKGPRPRDGADPPPAWESRAGREAAKLEIARALVENGNNEAGLALIGQMRADGVDGAEIDVLHGEALRKAGMLDDAESMLRAVVSRHPRDPDARNQLGVLLMDRHQVEAAVDSFRVAADLAADDAEIRNNLGFALLAAGRAAEAVDELRIALKLDSSRVRVRNNLGFALVAAGRDDEALRVFRAAGSEADARYNLGVGLERRGEVARATSAYADALATDPNHEPARSALERIGVSPSAEESK